MSQVNAPSRLKLPSSRPPERIEITQRIFIVAIEGVTFAFSPGLIVRILAAAMQAQICSSLKPFLKGFHQPFQRFHPRPHLVIGRDDVPRCDFC